jgi:hypothetical protein
MSEETREQSRSRRKRQVRPKTINIHRLPKRVLEIGALLFPEAVDREPRPDTRAECRSGPRPCPFVSCRYHLYLDVSRRGGAIKLNFPDLEVWELEHTCALDVADAGEQTLEQVGALLNMTRERVRQIENAAKQKLLPEVGRRRLHLVAA